MLFDAKVQSKSNEISQETFDLVKKETDEILQHMKHEKDEIFKIKSRLENLSLEDIIPTEPEQAHPIQDSAVSYLSNTTENEDAQTRLPEPPCESEPEKKISSTSMIVNSKNQTINSSSTQEKETEWLKRMHSQKP